MMPTGQPRRVLPSPLAAGDVADSGKPETMGSLPAENEDTPRPTRLMSSPLSGADTPVCLVAGRQECLPHRPVPPTRVVVPDACATPLPHHTTPEHPVTRVMTPDEVTHLPTVPGYEVLEELGRGGMGIV